MAEHQLPGSSEQPLDKDDLLTAYQQLRAYLEHEDELIDARISRALLLHGFLLAAYSLLLQAMSDIYSKPLGLENSPCLGEKIANCLSPQLIEIQATAFNLTVLIGWLGLLTAFGSLIGVHAANSAIRKLDKRGKKLWLGNAALMDRLSLPPLTGGGAWWNRILGTASAYFLPVVTLFMWAAICANSQSPQWLADVARAWRDWANGFWP